MPIGNKVKDMFPRQGVRMSFFNTVSLRAWHGKLTTCDHEFARVFLTLNF